MKLCDGYHKLYCMSELPNEKDFEPQNRNFHDIPLPEDRILYLKRIS